MTFGPTAVQTAIYSRLTGDATLMALINGVYDFVPDNKAFPFVTIGMADWTDRGSHTTEGYTGLVTVNSWTQARGRKTNLAILDEIDRLLHNVSLSVSGWGVISLRRDMTTVLVEDDAVTYHGIIRFKFLIGET
jgi:hypothetical protein